MSLPCTRCGSEMQLIKREKLQLGQTGWLLGDWPNLIAGALEVDIYCCSKCGKLEFYRSEMHSERIFSPSKQYEPSELPRRPAPSAASSMTSTIPPAPCAATITVRSDFMAFSLVGVLLPAALLLFIVLAVLWISHR